MLKTIIAIILLFTSVCFSQNENNQYMLGKSYQQAGRYEKSKSIFEQLYQNNPRNYQYFQSLNEIYLQLKDYNSSVSLIEARIKQKPDIQLYGLLGSTYYLMGDEQKAFEVWGNGLKNLPQSEINYRVIANFAIDRRAFDKAIDFLNEGKSIAKNPVYFSLDLANLYSLTMQYKNAAEEYASILKKEPKQLQLVISRIFTYISKPEALPQTISIFEHYKDDENLSFEYILAKLYVEGKNYDKAFELYSDIDKKQNSRGAELFNFAQLLYSENQFDLASKVYNEIIERYPESSFASTAKLGYAKTMEAVVNNNFHRPDWKPFYKAEKFESDKINKVIAAYKELSELYPQTEIAYESLYRIGKIELNKKDNPEKAEQYFNQIVEESPLSKFAPDALISLGDIWILKGNLDKAENFFLKVMQGRATNDKVNYAKYQLARLNLYKTNFDEAKSKLNEILKNLKDNSANDAIELSLLLNTTMNDSADLVIFSSGEFLAAQKKFNEAAGKYRSVSENPNAFMLKSLAELRVAEMELAVNNIDTTVTLLNKIADENEKNIYADKALYLLAKIYQFGVKDKVKAIKVYQKLLAKFPNSLYLDEARDEIKKLRKTS